ncbi:MAG: type II toxin-antitoxin system PemK/MazF family toxin [Chitinophagaceae bacterium]|nr:type II toxin-antitoxin system PemK/MazF family toxin [Chitinophagaceae bacterium]
MNNKILKWEIWTANPEPVVGSEQGKTRPVLIIIEGYTNDVLNVINLLPLTTRKNNRSIYPNEVLIHAGTSGLINESIVLCYQIRTIDKRKLGKRYGLLQDESLKEEIIEALKFQLGIM